MADGFAAIQAAAADKRNSGGTVANALKKTVQATSKGNNGPKEGAIARRLAKGSSKSAGPGDNGTNQESGY